MAPQSVQDGYPIMAIIPLLCANDSALKLPDVMDGEGFAAAENVKSGPFEPLFYKLIT